MVANPVVISADTKFNAVGIVVFMKNWLSRNLAFLTLVGPIILIFFVGVSLINAVSDRFILSEVSERTLILQLSNNLVHEMQKERGMSAGYLGSAGQLFKTELRTQRRLLDSAYKALQEGVADFNSEVVNSELATPLNAKLARLSSVRSQIDNQSIELADAIKYYTSSNAVILDFNAFIASHAKVAIFKQKLNSLFKLGIAKENAGIERALLNNAFARDQFDVELYKRWLSNVAQQEILLSSVEALSTDSFAVIISDFLRGPENSLISEFRRAASVGANISLNQNPENWFAAATARINKLKSVQEQLFDELFSHEADEINTATYIVILDTILQIFIIVLSVSIFLSLRRRSQQAIEIRRVMQAVEIDHDLSEQVKIITQDDLGDVANSLNTTVQRLRSDFNNFLKYAEEIAAASLESAATTQQTNVNIIEEKHSITHNLEASEELNKSIERDLVSIGKVHSTASSAKQSASEGEATVKQAVSGIKITADEVANVGQIMSVLNERVVEILGMVDVIRSVADQTNLLALNAAIEAARAGEQGRGFAVVADEVRALAKRTQDSTEEIARVVDDLTDSTKKAIHSVQQGNEKATEAVDSAEQINLILANVTANMSELDKVAQDVADSAQNQLAGVVAMTNEIRNIDTMSQQNADGANHLAAASSQLSSIANEMLTQIQQYKV